MAKLRELQVANFKPLDKRKSYEDEDGLRLTVFPQKKGGGKYWEKRYSWQGKVEHLSLGSYPKVSLATARLKNKEASLALLQGINPRLQKQLLKKKVKDSLELTFRILAEQWFANYSRNKVESTNKKVRAKLDNDIYPYLGHMPIESIKSKHVLSCLQPVVDRNSIDTAHRVKRIVHSIMDTAVIRGDINQNPAYKLEKLIPPIKHKHYPAITDPKKFGELLVAVDTHSGTPEVTTALKLMPLVFARSHELRSMKWKDVDWVKSEWRYVVTKKDINHIVPLSKQAIELLKVVQRFSIDSEYVFASSASTSGYISDNALLIALRRLGVTKEEMTVHGFRASARTIMHEVLGLDPNMLEQQLSHKTKNPLGEAYDRTKFLDARKLAMQEWADYCDELKGKANGR
ncbi:integrase arm-type DNA-binding domain-containing protein [Methylophilaceae bacterium]|nr:integrase arm-type DNA-binding domain-containing protein [Methylophilaceae bacterium]